jgi:hypothetical protein
LLAVHIMLEISGQRFFSRTNVCINLRATKDVGNISHLLNTRARGVRKGNCRESGPDSEHSLDDLADVVGLCHSIIMYRRHAMGE